MKTRLLLLTTLSAGLTGAVPLRAAEDTNGFPRVPFVPVEQAEKTFQAMAGFQMELIAAEPLVTDPVAVTYDENGRAFVVEMSDYPYTDKKTHQAWKDNVTDLPIGLVHMLEDTNGDGKFDKSTVFAEKLSWPTGIACWKGGVFVTATPDIWYFKDTDGDGKADIKEKVFTGFRKFNVQAVLNGLIWGLDHQIYGAASGNGGQVRPGDKAEAKPTALTRNDFRFNPVTDSFEAIEGDGRFGHTFDDWGHRFRCNIRQPVIHPVLPLRYLARNPYLNVASPLNNVSLVGDDMPVYRTSPIEPWRDYRAKVWAGDKKMPRSELVGGGVMTSVCGLTMYRGAAYPPEHYGTMFLAEVANNLLHREVMAPNGVTFTARRVDERADFVTSTDTWFRPVNFVNAPDGTLHVVDMYREYIEHPWSIPDDIREKLDLESGRDRGRLYRLAPPNFVVPKPPRLGAASTAELVATLENPNAWWRDTAHRLIFERQDQTAVPLLQKLVAKSKSPLARLHALWSLEGLKALSEKEILAGLNDAVPGVRENAIKLAEPRLKSPALLEKVLALAEDADMKVRFQAAFTLGETSDARAAQALTKLAQRDGADPWMRAAVLSSAVNLCGPLVTALTTTPGFSDTEGGRQMIQQAAIVLGAKNDTNAIASLLTTALLDAKVTGATRQAVVLGLNDGQKRAKADFKKITGNLSAPAAAVLKEVFAAAQQAALDAKNTLPLRQEAIALMRGQSLAEAKPVLVQLLAPAQPTEIRRAAAVVLSSFNTPEVAEMLIAQWKTYTPALRGEVAEMLLARFERLSPLFDAIEKGTIPAGQISAARRAVLLKHSNEALRLRAEKLFGDSVASPRKEAIAKYQAALSLKGDFAAGQKVFEANCMTCHRAAGKGSAVGPDLASVRLWPSDQILVNILDPNREVSPNYVDYTVELTDGETASGLIAAETANSLTLVRAGGYQETISRQNVKQITSSGVSLMPEGMEGVITPQNMADLLAFLTAK